MTHNERVLRLLSDGKPHTHHELYGLLVVAHSRVSDLRKQGYEISLWRDGDDYLYQLVSSPEVAPTAGPVVSPPDTGPVEQQQLVLEVAA
jgi:hypothetical protein